MSWESKKFGEFIRLQRGHDLTKEQFTPGPYPVVSSTSIMGFHNEYKAVAPGVVIGRSGTLGEVQYIDSDYWPHNTSLYVENFNENNPRFVYYFLKYFGTENSGGGSAVPTLNRNNLNVHDVLIPDIETQNRIAEILSAYDDLIENNQKQIKLLEEAAQRLYKEWFVDLRFPGHEEVPFVDGLPEGWERKNIEAVCDTIGGGTPSTKVKDYYESGNIPWVTPTDITKNNGLVILKSEKRITKAGLDHSSAKMLPPFTILMTSRASVGFFGISELSVCTNQGFISCVPYNENTRYYLLFNLMNRVEEIRQKSSGSTYMEINKTNFRAFEFVLPEDKVIEQFDFFARNIIRQVAVKAKTIQALQDARDRLLPKLMSGELEL